MCDNTNATMLETEVCSRCGGSGRYSYCQMYGDRCFKCFGKGNVLTKRGKVANDYLRSIRSKRADQIVAGDVIRDDGIPGFSGAQWCTVLSVVADGGKVTISTNVTTFGGWSGDSVFRVRQNKEDSARTFRMALEYQATLTKTGTPRVVRRKQVA